MASEAMSPKAEALRENIVDIINEFESRPKAGALEIARILVRELKLAEPEIHVPNALAHKLLPLLELAGTKQ